MDSRKAVFLLLIFFFPLGISAGEKQMVEYTLEQQDNGTIVARLEPRIPKLDNWDTQKLQEALGEKCGPGCSVNLDYTQEETYVIIIPAKGARANTEEVFKLLGRKMSRTIKKAGTTTARGAPSRCYFVKN